MKLLEKTEFKVELEYTEPYESPRDWDNETTMVCSHRRYNLGDVQPDMGSAGSWENEFILYMILNHESVESIAWDALGADSSLYDYVMSWGWVAEGVLNEVYETVISYINDHFEWEFLSLYDHSGISISLGKSSGWDCGCVGFVFTEKSDDSLKSLEREVNAYNQYISGDVVALTISIDVDGEEVIITNESEFYGYNEAKRWADGYIDATLINFVNNIIIDAYEYAVKRGMSVEERETYIKNQLLKIEEV